MFGRIRVYFGNRGPLYSVCAGLPNEKSSTTAAEKLYNDFILRFGFPSHILHDQGKEFENQLFHQIQKLTGIQRLRTTPYHPQTNGKAERFNRTLLSMLRTLPEDQKSKWKDSVNKVVHAYNCTVNNATGFSPFYLLFGRSPRLPIDLIFGTSLSKSSSGYRHYVQQWKEAMKEAYAKAIENSKKSATTGKRHYDKRTRFTDLQPGDRVLVRNLSERGGPGKLRAYWENEIYEVVERKGEMPVYHVKPEGQCTKKSKVLHRNQLLPCQFLSPESKIQIQPSPVRKITEMQRLQDKPNVRDNGETLDNEDARNADSDEDLTYGLTPAELSVTFPKMNVSNQVEEPEIEVPLIDVDSTTQEVSEVEWDDVNNQVMDDAAVSVPETGVYENETSVENEKESIPQRPVRNRRPPNMLQYDLMGHPTEFPPYVSSVQETNQTFPPQEAFWPQTPANPPISVFSPNPFPFPFPPLIPQAV